MSSMGGVWIFSGIAQQMLTARNRSNEIAISCGPCKACTPYNGNNCKNTVHKVVFEAFHNRVGLDTVVMTVLNDLSQDILEINMLTDKKTLLDCSYKQVMRSVGSGGQISGVLCLPKQNLLVLVMQMYLLLLIC